MSGARLVCYVKPDGLIRSGSARAPSAPHRGSGATARRTLRVDVEVVMDTGVAGLQKTGPEIRIHHPTASQTEKNGVSRAVHLFAEKIESELQCLPRVLEGDFEAFAAASRRPHRSAAAAFSSNHARVAARRLSASRARVLPYVTRSGIDDCIISHLLNDHPFQFNDPAKRFRRPIEIYQIELPEPGKLLRGGLQCCKTDP
jgi:hypothetical protein